MVTVAATVAEALDEIKKQEFDLLLSDLNIESERDGYTVIRAMRDANSNCINIVLTGYPDEESAAESLKLGIDDYIAKPANADALVAMLAEKLTGRKKAGEIKKNQPRQSRSHAYKIEVQRSERKIFNEAYPDQSALIDV